MWKCESNRQNFNRKWNFSFHTVPENCSSLWILCQTFWPNSTKCKINYTQKKPPKDQIISISSRTFKSRYSSIKLCANTIQFFGWIITPWKLYLFGFLYWPPKRIYYFLTSAVQLVSTFTNTHTLKRSSPFFSIHINIPVSTA